MVEEIKFGHDETADKYTVFLLNKVNEIIRALNAMERDHVSGVGPTALPCIPTARSQPDVSDTTPPAQARPASNTSQLAIAAREVITAYFEQSCSLKELKFSMVNLRSALQQQA